jgi:hypothetical protein
VLAPAEEGAAFQQAADDAVVRIVGGNSGEHHHDRDAGLANPGLRCEACLGMAVFLARVSAPCSRRETRLGADRSGRSHLPPPVSGADESYAATAIVGNPCRPTTELPR